MYSSGRKSDALVFGLGFFALLGATYAADAAHDRDLEAYQNSSNLLLLTSPLSLSQIGPRITDTTPYALNSLLLTDDAAKLRDRATQSALYASALRTVLAGLYIWNIVDVIVFRPSPDQFVAAGVHNDSAALYYSMRF